MVNHESSPSIDCLEAASQLAPEYVLGSIAKALEVAFWHVVEQRVIRESSFQLCLPDVVVGVDEARRHNLAYAVDFLGARTNSDGGGDLLDDVSFNQDVRIS